MILKTFVQQSKNKILDKLKIYLEHKGIGINKDQYLRMVEQTGVEIDWDKCPPDMEDFSDSVIVAISIYNSLGDRVLNTKEEYINIEQFPVGIYVIKKGNKTSQFIKK